jgi:hypothetical protein
VSCTIIVCVVTIVNDMLPTFTIKNFPALVVIFILVLKNLVSLRKVIGFHFYYVKITKFYLFREKPFF